MKNNNITTAAVVVCGILLSPLAGAGGSSYTGERDVQNRFHGWGVYSYLAGGKYEGEWQHGQKDGVGRRNWPDGSKFEGEWQDNLPHGKGIKTYTDGAQYSGDFRQGLREGKGTMRWTNGVEYTGEWKADQMEGEGSKRFADGTTYDGHFSKGLRNGWGTYVYADKTRYEGNWRNDMQDGKGALQFPDGGVYKGEFRQSQPHGHGELTYANGDRYSGQWQNGNLSGKGTLHYAVGGYYDGHWQRGKREGQGKWVMALGSTFTGPFVDDTPHGNGTCIDKEKAEPCRYDHGRRQAMPVAVVAENPKETLPAVTPILAPAVPASIPAPAKVAATPVIATAQVATLPTTVIPVPAISVPATPAAPTTQSAVAEKTEKPSAFKQAVAKAKEIIALSPQEQLSKFGAGMFFSHGFPKLALAEQPSFSWWSKTNALFSDNLKLILTRGKEQLQLQINSYKGPGVYSAGQYSAKMIKDGRVYDSAETSKDTIQIETDDKGWISGHFDVTLLETNAAGQVGQQRLENGVFRLSDKRPAAASALADVTEKSKPLMESVSSIWKAVLPN